MKKGHIGRILAMIITVSVLVPLGYSASGSVDLTNAHAYFLEMKAISDRDAGRLWGRPLYGPLLFVDSETRFAVSNQADSENRLTKSGDVYVGTLPIEIGVANHAATWAGVKWTMVRWPLPEDRVGRATLMAHESFHRIWTELGITAPADQGPCSHLDTLEGRYWLLMEWRALREALVTRAHVRLVAIADAILFRAFRRSLYTGSAAREHALELIEGLASYTGTKLADADESSVYRRAAESLGKAPSEPSFVRSFAYETGPAYGLLLDAAGASWRTELKPADDLADLLLQQTHLQLPADLSAKASERAKVYDDGALRAAEETRERERQESLKMYRAKLVDGPVLETTMTSEGSYGFDPRNLVPLEGVGTIFPYDFEVRDQWGVLEAQKGALMTLDYRTVYVAAPGKFTGSIIHGDGWTLTLNPGWILKPGKRPGDFILVRQSQQ